MKKCPECGREIDESTDQCGYCTAKMEHPPEKISPASPAPSSKGNTVNPHAEPVSPHRMPSSIGKYRIIRQIGKGAMGRVFLAKDPDLDRIVAIKTMISGEDASEKSIARFTAEARSAGKLKHPSIVSVHEIGHIGSTHFMVMDFIEGKTLESIIQQGKLKPRRTAEIIRDTAYALQYAHEHGVIHRDIKPANIIISRNGTVHLTDFGLARNLESDSSLTKSGEVMGTPVYLNPEQAEGRSKKVDPRSDIYSLGAVLYEMLTGAPPVTGDNLMQIIIQVMDKYPAMPSKLNSKIHRDIEIICMKALSKEPKRRYQTASQFGDDLDRFIAGEAISARPASFLYKATRHIRKHSISTALITAVISVSFLALYFQMKKTEKLENKTAHAVADRNRIAKALVQRIEKEKEAWIPLYSQYFYSLSSLPEQWQSRTGASVRDKALYLDGKNGRSAAWLSLPLPQGQWQIEFDARASSGAPRLNTIGITINSGGDFKSGLSVFYGSSGNTRSGIVLNGQQLFSSHKSSSVERGHTYHFIITSAGRKLRYIVIDTATGKTAIDTSISLPSSAPAGPQAQHAFWTENSQILVDNIVFRKRGIPADRLDAAARDFKDILGPQAAALFLLEKLRSIPDRAGKKTCLSRIIEYSCASQPREQAFLSTKIADAYVELYPDRTPSDMFTGKALALFYRITLLNGSIEHVRNGKMRKLLQKDSRVTSYRTSSDMLENLQFKSRGREDASKETVRRSSATKKGKELPELQSDAPNLSASEPTGTLPKQENNTGISGKSKENEKKTAEGKHITAHPVREEYLSDSAALVQPKKDAGTSDQPLNRIRVQLEAGTDFGEGSDKEYAGKGKPRKSETAVVQAALSFKNAAEDYFAEHTGKYLTIQYANGSETRVKIESVGNGTVTASKTEFTGDRAAYSRISIHIADISLRQKIRLVKPDLTDRDTALALYIMADKEKDQVLVKALKAQAEKHPLFSGQ